MTSAAPARLLLLCTADPDAESSLHAFEAVGYAAALCRSFAELRQELSPSVAAVLLDANLPKDTVYQIYRFLRAETDVPFLVLVPPPRPDEPSWVIDLDHGEREDFARQPLTVTEIALRLHALLVRSGRTTLDRAPLAMATGSAPPGQIVCVFGADGGVGKTTIAVHLAVGLARFCDARVALIDGDLWMGDCVVGLNLTASRTILDAVAAGLPTDAETWMRALVPHPSGVQVLAPPSHLEDVERVPEGAVAAAARALRRYFDFVVVDLDDRLNASTLQVLEAADQVLVVLTPDLGPLRHTVRLLRSRIETGLKRTGRIVLNRSNAGLDLAQIREVLQHPIAAMIPSDGRLFVAALNDGQTVFNLDRSGRSDARRALEALAVDVAAYGRPKAAPKKKDKGLAGLFRRGAHR